MRRILTIMAALLVIIIGLPAIIAWPRQPKRPTPTLPPSTQSIRLYLHSTGQITELPLEEYIAGVVAGEMPSDFAPAALEAQAVAARTYTLRKLQAQNGAGSPQHPGADLCDDPTHNQAWVPLDSLEQRKGKAARLNIVSAVANTAGQIITYQGAAIDAIFHSTCGGATENASDVWGRDIPYLRSVICQWCTHSPHFHEEVRVPINAVISKLKAKDGAIEVSASQFTASANPIQVTSMTLTGRVKQVAVGGKTLSGPDFRTTLGLPSTRVSWTVDGADLVVDSKGYGHGVGLCQYGADGMGRMGYTYKEILAYYYPGTRVEVMKP